MHTLRLSLCTTLVPTSMSGATDGFRAVAEFFQNVQIHTALQKCMKNDGNPIYETCHEIFWTNDNKWDCERDEDCEWRVIAWKEKDKPYQPKGE